LNDMTIVPVLLCGGSGTRLWPLSRKSFPKQFVPLLSDESLFQASARRVSGPDYAPPVVVTAADYRFIVAEQLLNAGIEPGTILIEPDGRNTAPAILAAALHISAHNPKALMLVVPSDHVIPDALAFRAAVAAGIPSAQAGSIVTFGIRPTRPETGYGWLELSSAALDDAPIPLTRFVEKPDAKRAAAMLADGNFLWNAGIFLFTADTILAAFKAHAPRLMEPVQSAVTAARPDLGFLRLDKSHWAGAESISIDFAVMEQAENRVVVPFGAGWSDLGDWEAVALQMGSDAKGVSLSGAATAIDCRNSLLRSDQDGVEIVGIGLDGIVAVAMGDAVLIADRTRSQDVRLAVSALKARGAKQADTFPRDHRPWGWFETLALSERFQVKRIVVKPGGILSLQSHMHRAEHWIVVSGTARVTLDDSVSLVTENQSVYIPLGAQHRMENPGKVPMVLIEVQTGVYLGEDDIARYEDAYAR
jgi:mannose-1-phosphate guanylyltransferase / mannose-6-phosphate isomerase